MSHSFRRSAGAQTTNHTNLAMAASATKPDKRNRHTSLSSLLRFFEDTELTVETKKGKFYRGILSSSDEAMNLTLDDCFDQESRLANVHIRGSTIRYIHFPNQTDLSGVIRSGIDREKAAANKYKRGLRKGK
jgi:small nuclear ribonucleoprotein (snRNP)-like protein